MTTSSLTIFAYMKEHPHLSVATCASNLQVSVNRIYHVLRSNGLPRTQFKGLNRNAYRIIALLQNTKQSYAGIGTQVGLGRERVRAVAESAAFNGIKFKKRGK